MAAHDEDGDRDDHEGEVPHEVQDHYRLRVGPVALPLLDLLLRSFPHADGGLPHRAAAAAGVAEQGSGAAEAERAAEEAGPAPRALVTEQRRGVDGRRRGGRAVVVRRHRFWDERGFDRFLGLSTFGYVSVMIDFLVNLGFLSPSAGG